MQLMGMEGRCTGVSLEVRFIGRKDCESLKDASTVIWIQRTDKAEVLFKETMDKKCPRIGGRNTQTQETQDQYKEIHTELSLVVHILTQKCLIHS